MVASFRHMLCPVRAVPDWGNHRTQFNSNVLAIKKFGWHQYPSMYVLLSFIHLLRKESFYF
jgi:hypothetical protein